MSAVKDALDRWWRDEAPEVQRRAMKHYRVARLCEEAMTLFTNATGEAFRAGWRACEEGRATSVKTALDRWWSIEAPMARRTLLKYYRVAHLEEEVIRLIGNATGEAFRAGWHARDTYQRSQGQQRGLFDVVGDGD